jgi:hypothetical protein
VVATITPRAVTVKAISSCGPRRDGPGVDAVELGVQAEVLLGGEVAVERRVLEHEADVPADVVALAGDVEAAHTGGAGGGPGERAEHVDALRGRRGAPLLLARA